MARNADDFFVGLPKKRLEAIDAHANAMLAEEMTLIELRKKLLGSQAKLGKKMGIKQAAVSRLEHRADMHVSTLKQIISALGGKVKIIAQFANRPAVSVSLFDALDVPEQPVKARSRKVAKVKAKVARKPKPEVRKPSAK
jgi:transcriptional regulator with XRE-family HTH domain